MRRLKRFGTAIVWSVKESGYAIPLILSWGLLMYFRLPEKAYEWWLREAVTATGGTEWGLVAIVGGFAAFMAPLVLTYLTIVIAFRKW